jgi:putative endonuclease
MAALVPAIQVLHHLRMSGGYVYIMASAPNGILYVGVTSDLVRRVYEHRNGLFAGFTKRYSVKRLVYFEHYEEIQAAIQREHNIKHWSRKWKVRLILADIRLDRLRTWMAGTSPAMTTNTNHPKYRSSTPR